MKFTQASFKGNHLITAHLDFFLGLGNVGTLPEKV